MPDPLPRPAVTRLRYPVSPWMSRQEVADFLRCHPNSVDKLARDGLLTKYHIQGLKNLLYARKEVEGIVFEGDPETATAPGAEAHGGRAVHRHSETPSTVAER